MAVNLIHPSSNYEKGGGKNRRRKESKARLTMTGIMKWIPRIHTAPFLPPPGINKTDELEDPTTPSSSSFSFPLDHPFCKRLGQERWLIDESRWKPPCISSSIDSQRRLKLVEKSNSGGGGGDVLDLRLIDDRWWYYLFLFFFFNLYCSLFSPLDVDGIDLLWIYFEK